MVTKHEGTQSHHWKLLVNRLKKAQIPGDNVISLYNNILKAH